MSQFFCTVELPEELWLYILGFIDDARTLLAVGSTDRRLNRLVEDDLVWQDLFERLLYRRTRREEELGTPYRILFQKQYRLDCAWYRSVNYREFNLNLEVPRAYRNRAVTALIAGGGDRPLVIASYPGSGVQVYDLEASSVFRIPDDTVRALALVLDAERAKYETGGESLPAGLTRGWGSNELLLVTGGRKLRVWNVPCRYNVPNCTLEISSGVRSLCAIDGTPLLLSGSKDGSVRLWNLQTGNAVCNLSGFGDSVLCLAGCNSQPAPVAAGGSMDGSARIWNLETGEAMILRGHCQPVHRILVNGDTVITGSIDSSIRTWKITTGNPLSLITTHKVPVGYLAITPSPTRSLVSISFDGMGALHALDDAMGVELAVPQSSKFFISYRKDIVDSSHFGPYFVAGGLGGTLSIFRITNREGDDAAETTLETRPKLSAEIVRTINTGFVNLYRLAVLRRGIIAVGALPTGKTSVRFYDFAPREE